MIKQAHPTIFCTGKPGKKFLHLGMINARESKKKVDFNIFFIYSLGSNQAEKIKHCFLEETDN